MINTKINRRQIWCFCLGITFFLTNSNVIAEPLEAGSNAVKSAITQFNVSYQSTLMGTKLTATSKLRPLEGGLYEYSYNTKSMLGKASETSRFTLAENTRPVPQAYKYKLSAMGVKNRISLAFDWETGRVTDRAAEPRWTLDLPSGALDPLSMQLKLREDVMRGETSLTYQVTRKGRIKEYHFVVEAEEITETLIGPLRTVRVRRDRGDDSPKFTMIWLAVDWSHTIAKIRDGMVDGRTQEVVLAGGSVDGVPISPLIL